MALSSKALTTISAAREFVLRDTTEDTQDPKLERLINAYSSAIFAYTEREWRPHADAASRVFLYNGSGFLSLAPYDLRTLTSLVLYTDLPTSERRTLIAGTTTVEGEYRLGPSNRTPEGTYQYLDITTLGLLSPWWHTTLRRRAGYEVTVTGNWGIADTIDELPDDVELACLIAVADAYRNPVGYQSETVGGVTINEALAPAGSYDVRAGSLPPEARALLTPYKRGARVAVA